MDRGITNSASLPGTTDQAVLDDQALDPQIAEIAERLFDHIEGQISRIDIKAQLIVAADAFLIAAVTTHFKGSALILSTLGDGKAPMPEQVIALGTMLTAATLVISFLSALWTVRPSLKAPRSTSLVFFGSIASQSRTSFIESFRKQSVANAQEDLLAEIYVKSRIARGKYRGVRNSVICLLIALFFWSVVEILLAFLPT